MDDKIRDIAQTWKENVTEPDLLEELDALMADADEERLSDAFYRSLAFGTAGLRGTLGVGTNRMNVYTVAQASQGLATYLNAHYDSPTVAIARDSRNKGEDFVKAAAGVLAANGIKSFVYPRIEPVPTLSFATRDLRCSAGICVTASHNPAQYNGYKVYGDDGCQIANEAADEIQATIDKTDIFHGVKQMDFDEALEKGLELCDKVHPDLMLATDPDADRMGVAVPHDGDYKLLTGNEMGILLTDWLTKMKAEAGEDVSRKVVVTTIVSTVMPDAIARAKGFEVRRVLTGFKNIGGQMDQLVEAGTGDRFLMGFEESYGYLVGLHARDKDAIVASMLTCEMAAWYAERGMDLYEAMEALYKEYGYYLNGVVNVSFPGAAGANKMAAIMTGLRENPPAEIAGLPVEGFVDYKTDVEMPAIGGDGSCPKQLLPKSNVLEYRLGEGVKVIVRPSGTEPKIKAYLFSKGATREESQALNDKLAEFAKSELLA